MNTRKKVYSTLKGSFSGAGINEFVGELFYGRSPTIPFKGSLSPVQTVEPWDGKDGEVN